MESKAGYDRLAVFEELHYDLGKGPAETLDEYFNKHDPDGAVLANQIAKALKEFPQSDALARFIAELVDYAVDFDFDYADYFKRTLNGLAHRPARDET